MTSTNEKDEAELRRLAEAKCAEAAKLEAEAEKPRAAPHRETFYDLSGNEPVPMRYDADLANAQRQIEREQLLRRALEEYSESSRLFRRADDRCSLASVEENIGRLYFKLKDLKRARARLKLAEKLHEKNGDRIAAARVRVTRADVFTEQGDYVKALRLARDAAGRLQQHHPGETARALITSARALARQGNIGRAESALRLAYKTAIESGDAERAADAGLVMIEEIHALMNAAELLDCFDKTNKLLQSPQNIATLNRLNERQHRHRQGSI
jgi:tetratricopeptide (TPR) repeat protein